MSRKTLFKWGFKAQAERLAEHYRQEMQLSKFAPLDAFALAGHLHIPIFCVDEFEDNLPAEQLNRLRDTDHFSAMWLPNEEGNKIIVHNNYHSAKRQQSNLMHELAHIILKHEISEEAAKLCFLYGLHYFNKEQEEEAKYFGSCLQIAKPGVLWALKRMSLEEISDHFMASTDMVKYRINSIGKQFYLSKN